MPKRILLFSELAALEKQVCEQVDCAPAEYKHFQAKLYQCLQVANMVEGKRWVIHDSDGNSIYLTQERWQHIIGAENHPEMEDFEDLLKLTLRRGSRRQEPLNPRKYRYVHPFNNLPDGSNHIVAIILFGFDINEKGQMTANNYVATAFFKHIKIKG